MQELSSCQTKKKKAAFSTAFLKSQRSSPTLL